MSYPVVRRRARVFASLIVAGLAVFCLAGRVAGSAPPRVIVAPVDAIIQPVSAQFMIDTIDRADAEHVQLLVFVLETPGGRVDSTRAVITRMLAARTPIAMFVAPAGARAASAGFLLTLAADVAAMAPGTHIGAAHPVGGQGEKLDDTVAEKAVADLSAYARTLAHGRGRNVELAEQAVRQSRAFTEEEARQATPPLIDFVVPDVATLVAALDGQVIRRFDGTAMTLRVAGATMSSVRMPWRQRVLSALAHPNIAYLLLSIGMLGLTIELWSPGAILPGVVGGISLLLAFLTFQVLPVNYVGVLLIVFGLVLLVLEVKVTSYGVLGGGGLVGLVLGALVLFDRSAPDLRVSLSLIVPVVAAMAVILVFLVRLAMASQRRRPVTGVDGLLGQRGVVVTPIGPASAGRVRVSGELWTAVADTLVSAGSSVDVVAIDGLTVTVRPSSESKELTA